MGSSFVFALSAKLMVPYALEGIHVDQTVYCCDQLVLGRKQLPIVIPPFLWMRVWLYASLFKSGGGQWKKGGLTTNSGQSLKRGGGGVTTETLMRWQVLRGISLSLSCSKFATGHANAVAHQTIVSSFGGCMLLPPLEKYSPDGLAVFSLEGEEGGTDAAEIDRKDSSSVGTVRMYSLGAGPLPCLISHAGHDGWAGFALISPQHPRNARPSLEICWL